MPQKKHKAEEIVAKLRQVDVLLSQGRTADRRDTLRDHIRIRQVREAKEGSGLNALQRAIAVRHPLPGLIHHTDRDSQYCSHDYQRLLKTRAIIPSMIGKGERSKRSRISWSGVRFSTLAQRPNWPWPIHPRRPRRRHSALDTIAGIIRGRY
jgi:transposase InsO family protein